MKRRLIVAVTIVVVLLLVLNVISAFIATRPALQARLFGANEDEPMSPADHDLEFEDVRYGVKRTGWWIPVKDATGAVVLVHGFNLSDDPIRFASEPLVPFAADLNRLGYSVFAVRLGYATGAHNYTGGRAEADDIERAVRWVREQRCDPVVVWGLSAGGHDSLVAAAKSDGIAGVVSDSAFANTGEIVKQQAALSVHLPQAFLALTPPLFSLFGGRDGDVAQAWEGRRGTKPVLVIHGDADEAIAPSNGKRIAEITGGELWSVPGADHTGAYDVAREEYLNRASSFLEDLSGEEGEC